MSVRFDGCMGWAGRRFAAAGMVVFLLAGVVFQSSAAPSVTLAWQANSETNLSGYRLYFGPASRAYSGMMEVPAPATSATVPNLQSGLTYYFAVTAFTSGGLESDYSVEVSYTVPVILSPLTLVIHGDGTVTPNLHGQNLIVGHGYQLTAVPGDGQTFSSWGGDVSGSGQVLTFVMQSNMVIEATFEANPFILAQGTYSGLLAETDEVRHEHSGNFTLTATKRGTYTGKLQVGQTKGSIKGSLARDGKATNVVVRPGQSPLRVEVSVDVGATPGRITGRVTDGTWTALLLGDRHFYNSKTNPAPFAGSYTLVVPSEDGGPGPQGHGYGTVKVDRNGAATFLGMMADGTKGVNKASLSQEGHWPFYLGLYKGTGSALGWLMMTNAGVGGLVSWIKPAMVCKYYAGGLTNEANVVGAAYFPPTTVGPGVRHAGVTFSGANLGEVISAELMVLPNGKMVVHQGGTLKFGFSPTTGLFKGTVTDPLSGNPRSFSGVLLQNLDSGAGLILGTNTVGRVELNLD